MTDADSDWSDVDDLEASSDDRDGSPPIVDMFTSTRAALVASLESTPHLPRDRALIALALRYADLIDDALDRSDQADGDDEPRDFARMVGVVAKVGPRLEAVLDKLLMSPGARPVARGGEDARPDPAAAALALIRAAAGGAATGVDYAASVDPSVTEADTGH